MPFLFRTAIVAVSKKKGKRDDTQIHNEQLAKDWKVGNIPEHNYSTMILPFIEG